MTERKRAKKEMVPEADRQQEVPALHNKPTLHCTTEELFY